MDSRAQFEAWFRPKKMAMQIRGISTVRIVRLHQRQWEAWQASRAEIEIEPPKFIDSREALKMGHMVDYSNGFGDAMDAYEASIKSVGISIKGESS